jgi:hypothetical protein
MDATDPMPASTTAELSAAPLARLVAVAKAGTLLFVLAAWPLALLKNLPHEDLLGHVAAAFVTQHPAAYPEYVAAHGLRTNSALLAWLQLAAQGLGYMGAARVFVIAVLAVTAFGYAFLFNALGGSKRMWLGTAFAIPLVHHWFVAMGMLNFSLSFGICLWIFGLLALQRAAWSNGRAIIIVALSALAWFAHNFPLLTVGLIVLADLGYARLRDRDSLQAAWRATASLVPAGIIAALGLVVAPAVGGAGSKLAGLEKTEWMGVPKLLWMGLRNYVLGASYWGIASIVPALILLGVIILRGKRRPPLFSTAAAAVLTAGYAFLPSFMFPIWAYFNTRFVPFLWLALLARLPQSLPRKLVALVVCAGVAGTVGNGLALLRMDADVAEFRSGLPFVEKGARLLPLLFSVASPGDNIEPVLHAWGHYAIERQTSADLLWASRSVDAVQYQTPPPPRFHHDVIQNMPRQMATAEGWCETLLREAGTVPDDCRSAWVAEWRSYLSAAQKRYTHVLLWDAPEPAMDIVNDFFPIVHRQGRLAIGRRL